MSEKLGGNKHPRIEIYNNGKLIERIDFPHANIDGRPIDTQQLDSTHELEGGLLSQDVEGYRKSFFLSYEEWTKVAVVEILDKLLRYRKQGYTMILTPFVDVLMQRYEVILASNSKYNEQILSNGGRYNMYKGVAFEFVTIRYITPEHFNPDELTVSYDTIYNFAVV